MNTYKKVANLRKTRRVPRGRAFLNKARVVDEVWNSKLTPFEAAVKEKRTAAGKALEFKVACDKTGKILRSRAIMRPAISNFKG